MGDCPDPGPELRSWVAIEIMGWKKGYYCMWYSDDEMTDYACSELATSGGWADPEFRPDEDRNHTASMEDRLEEMGLGDVWGSALLGIARDSANEITEDEGAVAYFVAHASAYDRVRAAWEVMKR